MLTIILLKTTFSIETDETDKRTCHCPGESDGWQDGDNIAVEIGGTSVYEIEGAGTKWAPVKGTRKYNKDAFIVIKNLDRNPTAPSQPNPDLKAHHLE